MNFLRKYQRALLIVVSVMTIASFSFFGTFSSFQNGDRVVDKEIAKAVNGSPIMERDVQAMIRFLSFGGASVVEKDLLATGMAPILAERYFNEIRDEFQGKLEKINKYKPYIHPQAPFLSAEEIWKRFVPDMSVHLTSLKKKNASPKAFALYCQLYLDQAAFPPTILKRILSYQQQQLGWAEPDPMMTEQRLALFGFQSLEEWFGEAFMRRLSCFLINTSIMAQEKGYKISSDEARADLLQNALYTLKSYSQKQEVSYQDANEFLHHQLGSCGIDEVTAIKIWKQVMLFRRMFDDVGQAIFLDPLTYEQFAAYAGESASIELYQLPQHLRLRDFRSLLKFQLYLDSVAPKNRSSLARLPTQFLSPAELEKRVPELVLSRFHLEVSRVKKEEIAQRITLKESWDFEVSDHGWASLKQEFPILGKNEAGSREGRFQALEGIDPQLRLKIDRSARNQIVAMHPEWIEEALQKTSSEKVQVGIRSKGSTYPFTDIENPSTLLTFLYQAPIGEKLPIFTSEKDVFYKITVLEKPQKKEIMTYQEADNVLGELLDKQLEEGYASVRKKYPEEFQLKDGSWKPFHEVKDLVGAKVFSDFLKYIAQETSSLDEYSSRRLASFMEEAKRSIREKGDNSPYLTLSEDPLKDQWRLVKRSTTIKRSDTSNFIKEEMFSATEGAWSSVSTPLNGDTAFFRLLNRQTAQDGVSEQIDEGQRILSMDAKRLLMHQVLERIEIK